MVNIAVVLTAGLIVGCGPSMPSYDYAAEPDPRRSEYVVGVGDALAITVWKNPALSGTVTVRPDGTITMPLVGDLDTKGKTPTQLRVEVAKRVAEYVKLDSSEITIAVTEVNSYAFTISGEVARPGMVTSKQYLTVAEAIAQAGGFTRFAKRDEITLTRRATDGSIKRIPIVYEFIENGTHPEMNLVMLSGDSLHVP